ncbi:uncharacterized protein Z518_09907 [Rhinocladiella mackenziei CBS 650.93]|uniref:Cytochrome P450 monooxygenase n=1 Tax=Rhinocladiella mackenziei CBS 650.93 TaxID=1442369 RepID=A0A0D2FFQ1_9EURO|nr:uncharacterized protein Z518_09907 [Rhinocladiella mackenziei CBS 650.93]KIX00842.1 hypothetical protein Z518_09907 [Rhinocladiella mackenziei CBS 650.93]
MSSPYLLLAVALTGVASHLFFFKIGERHLYPLRYVQAFLLGCTITIVAKSHYGRTPTRDAMAFTAKYATLYLAGLYTSLIIYRLFFNPLNQIPGPFWMRLSRFDFVLRVAAKMNSHHTLLALHQKYGPFVRIGPNDISVTHPDGVEVISGIKSKCSKAQWYSQDVPLISMHTCRDRAQHDRRRRIWSPAFSDKALRGYESRVRRYNELLIEKLDESNGQPLDMSKWFNLYSFDVMGDLGFGTSFHMLESGELHWAIRLLNLGMDPMGFCLPPWVFRLMTAIPGLAAGYWKFIGYCSDQLDARMKVQVQHKANTDQDRDITYTLIEHYNASTPEAQNTQLPMLQGDSRLIIVAGSDTTAATLVHLFYHLATEKGLMGRLREELDMLLKDSNDGEIEHQKIQDALLLNGVINETLRLHPPVPSGVFRKTPPEGVEIAGTYIPGFTVIQMPQYVMARDPTIYADPQTFIPERFGSRSSELMFHRDAFAPFSTGPYACIGKNLAYMEIRLLTAQLVRRFDVSLAPGETGQKLLGESKDHFTMGLGECFMTFTRREAGKEQVRA